MRLAIAGDYPEDWKAIAHAVKCVAEWRCIRCHHPFDQTQGALSCDGRCDLTRGPHRYRGELRPGDLPPRGINLGVHHLDGDKANCRWWNLLALCNSCHLSIQARVIPDRPWLFEHSLWFIDYVCGFYAWHYAQQDISLKEARAQPGDWLALGQPWLSHSPESKHGSTG